MPGNLHTTPPEVYLKWPTPNYVDPLRQSWMPIYASMLQAASSLTVILRLWLRSRGKAGPLGLDDALLFPAWLASIAYTVFMLLSTERYGSGTHIWNVQWKHFEPLAFCGWCAEVTYLISTCCTKCSILLFYRRLTKGSYNMRWKYCILVAIGFTVAYLLAFILLIVFSCSPTHAYWKSYNPQYNEDFTCVTTTYTNALSGVMSILSDLYSVLLPCLMLRKFDAPRRQKIALNIIFSLGLLVVAAGSVRTYYLVQLGHSYDLTWLSYDLFVWAQLEIQLSLICASAPALRVFIRRYMSEPITRAFSSRHSTSVSNPKNSLRDSRRTSKRLADEDPIIGRPAMPKTSSKIDSKQGTGSTLSEIELELSSPPCSSLGRSTTATSEGSEYPLKDLEASRPQPIYFVREKQSIDDYDLHGTRRH